MIGAWLGAGGKLIEMLVLQPSGSWREPQSQAVALMGVS